MSKTTEVRQQTWTAPAAANATALTSAHALDGSTLTVFSAQPDFARKLQAVASGAATGNLVITGKDIQGNVITETLALNGATPVKTVNAYASVTSIVLPTVAATTINIGTSSELGLDCYADENSFAAFAGVSAFTHNATIIAENTVTLTASLDGATDQSVAYIPSEFPEFGRAWG